MCSGDKIHLPVPVKRLQHRRDFGTDPGTVHADGNPQGIQNRRRRARFSAGEKVLRSDLRVFIRLQKAAFQKKRVSTQYLAEKVYIRLCIH